MGKDSPAPPDYTAAAQATAASNIAQNKQQTIANRPDVYTPWGSQTWENTPSFDQKGYDTALAAYSAANPASHWIEGTPGGYTSGGNNDSGSGGTFQPGTEGHWEGGTNVVGKAPDKGDFQQDNWVSHINLTPESQAALDAQQKIQAGKSTAAEGLLKQATDQFNTPFDWNSFTPRQNTITSGKLQTDIGDGSDSAAYRQKAQDAVDELQRPQLEQRRAAEQTRLANMGLTMGSQPYTNDMRDVADNENRAHLMAIDSGRAEAAQMFNQDATRMGTHNAAIQSQFGQDENAANFQNTSRQAQIAELAQRRGMTLNELNALLTGTQVQNPQMPQVNQSGKGAGTDYSGAAGQQYSAATDAANASNASSAQTTSALASIGTAAAFFAFSDARLKEDVTEVGLLPSGVRVVHYRYRGRPRRYLGVIAQEVAQVFPEAVSLHPSGFFQVDYSKVH